MDHGFANHRDRLAVRFGNVVRDVREGHCHVAGGGQVRHEMIKRTSIWVISLVVVALLVTQVVYRLFEREQSHRVVPPGSRLAEQVFGSSDEDHAASAAHEPEQARRSQPIPSQSGLHQRLLAMTEPERNQIFYLIIRDAGAECTQVMSSQYLIAESRVWHAHCDEAQSYSIVIDDLGTTSVHPIPNEDVFPDSIELQ